VTERKLMKIENENDVKKIKKKFASKERERKEAPKFLLLR